MSNEEDTFRLVLNISVGGNVEAAIASAVARAKRQIETDEQRDARYRAEDAIFQTVLEHVSGVAAELTASQPDEEAANDSAVPANQQPAANQSHPMRRRSDKAS